MKVDTRTYYDFDDVMIVPQLSIKGLGSRDEVKVTRKFLPKPDANRPNEWEGVPIIAANMDTVGTFEMAEALMEFQCCTALHKHYEVTELANFFTKHVDNQHLLFYSMGINNDSLEKYKEFRHIFGTPKNICIDVANGYMQRFYDFISTMRELAPDSMIMAGNVITGDATYAALKAGASIVKVGLGSGSACTTRIITGVGTPQLSVVMECANAAHGMDGLICSDGGCVNPCDVSKAIGGGADFVMMGGMLAGHDESGGELIYEDDKHTMNAWNIPNSSWERTNTKKTPKYVEYYGMSSKAAMNKHSSGVAKYKASEGRILRVPYRGSVADTITEILGGVRSTMLYVGAEELKNLGKSVRFIAHNKQLNTSLAQYET
jgi:GMP reductase